MAREIYCHAQEALQRLFVSSDQDRQAGIKRMRSASNAGLVWSRYLDIWEGRDPPGLVEGTERREVLETFVLDFNGRGKLPSSAAVKLLGAIHNRQKHAIHHLRGTGDSMEAILESRLATGLGAPHPTEIGFTFERSTGVPYLPGSSVKGIARAAAGLFGDQDEETLFGPGKIERDSKAWAGDLVFLDAYPVVWPRLEVDIINCHHSPYYGGKRSYPAETDDPVPVYFLTVAAGARFAFRVLSRSGKPDNAAAGLKLLRRGLTELGAGAKTAVGYGAFVA